MSMFGASETSPRMFKSNFLDLFSRTHYIVVPLLFVPAIALMLFLSLSQGVSIPVTAGLAAVGFVAWTFTEYWLHRTAFHWKPDTSWGPKFHFFVHGVHHDWPSDRYRLVMPPAVSIALFFLFLGFFVLTMGTTYAWAFHGGFVLGYLAYDMIHYYVHHGKPTSAVMKRLRRHHMSHHFAKKYKDRRYGVSNRVWDKIFGTN